MARLSAPRQLSDHLYVIYSEFPHSHSGNVYLITGRVPTLIDCGSRRAVPQIRHNLAALGMDVRDIVQVLATHGDFDHTQGFHDLVAANPDLWLYLHPADWPLVQQADPYRNAAYLYSDPFAPIASELIRPLDEDEPVAAGDGELAVIHTPGHTEGSVCFWGEIDGRQVLFAGDTIGGSMRSLRGADLALWAKAMLSWEESLKRISLLDIDWILDGHEPVHGLPLTRERLDRSIASFGKMLNPWFTLNDTSEDDAEPVPAAVWNVG